MSQQVDFEVLHTNVARWELLNYEYSFFAAFESGSHVIGSAVSTQNEDLGGVAHRDLLPVWRPNGDATARCADQCRQ